MKTIKQLEENKHLIKESYTDEKGNLIREVNGKKIIQVKEQTQKDIDFNERCNLWRMRNM